MGVGELPGKERIQEKVGHSGIVTEGGDDRIEQSRPDDAPGPPEVCDLGHVDVPAAVLRCRLQQHEPLGIGNDLRPVQRIGYVGFLEAGIVVVCLGEFGAL